MGYRMYPNHRSADSNITQSNSPQSFLLSKYDSKDDSHRMKLYLNWLTETAQEWLKPDLETYRDYLLYSYHGRDDSSLSEISVKAHLSTIRGRYRSILRQNKVRDYLYNMTSDDLSPSDKKAFVDEILERLRNAIDPENSIVKTISQQDIHDEQHLRLTQSQVQDLLNQPDRDTLIGLRDLSVISMMLCTGIREAELCALNIEDLYKRLGGQPALHIRRGKGAKERLVPYGDLIWAPKIIETWLAQIDKSQGAVFYGFFKGGKKIRSSRLTVRAINQILEKYPIKINDSYRTVNPHDLRRTYARQLYEAGMDLLAIRDNLGHVDTRTTLRYIGTMDVEARKPGNVYNYAIDFIHDDLPT